MGTINGMDLTDAEDNNKKWQEYTEELYKNDLHLGQESQASSCVENGTQLASRVVHGF